LASPSSIGALRFLGKQEKTECATVPVVPDLVGAGASGKTSTMTEVRSDQQISRRHIGRGFGKGGSAAGKGLGGAAISSADPGRPRDVVVTQGPCLRVGTRGKQPLAACTKSCVRPAARRAGAVPEAIPSFGRTVPGFAKTPATLGHHRHGPAPQACGLCRERPRRDQR
jgi:hypothetical protein